MPRKEKDAPESIPGSVLADKMPEKAKGTLKEKDSPLVDVVESGLNYGDAAFTQYNLIIPDGPHGEGQFEMEDAFLSADGSTVYLQGNYGYEDSDDEGVLFQLDLNTGGLDPILSLTGSFDVSVFASEDLAFFFSGQSEAGWAWYEFDADTDQQPAMTEIPSGYDYIQDVSADGSTLLALVEGISEKRSVDVLVDSEVVYSIELDDDVEAPVALSGDGRTLVHIDTNESGDFVISTADLTQSEIQLEEVYTLPEGGGFLFGTSISDEGVSADGSSFVLTSASDPFGEGDGDALDVFLFTRDEQGTYGVEQISTGPGTGDFVAQEISADGRFILVSETSSFFGPRTLLVHDTVEDQSHELVSEGIDGVGTIWHADMSDDGGTVAVLHEQADSFDLLLIQA